LSNARQGEVGAALIEEKAPDQMKKSVELAKVSRNYPWGERYSTT